MAIQNALYIHINLMGLLSAAARHTKYRIRVYLSACMCVCVRCKGSWSFGMNYSAGAAKTKQQLRILSGFTFNGFP